MLRAFCEFFALRITRPASFSRWNEATLIEGGERKERVIFILLSFVRLVGSHLQRCPSHYWPGLQITKLQPIWNLLYPVRMLQSKECYKAVSEPRRGRMMKRPCAWRSARCGELLTSRQTRGTGLWPTWPIGLIRRYFCLQSVGAHKFLGLTGKCPGVLMGHVATGDSFWPFRILWFHLTSKIACR